MSEENDEPGSLEEKIEHLLRDSSAHELTPFQAAFTKLTWVIVAATLVSVGFIAWVWYAKLPRFRRSMLPRTKLAITVN